MKSSSSSPARLYVVGTPLGNLKDITFRAVEILSSVTVIACEDTRHSRKLLDHYGIKARLLSYHDYNEARAAERIVSLVQDGLDVALVSDAGTPGISDPGYRVVSLALERGLEVVPVPGPSALTAALCAAGLPIDRFLFVGFLPARAPAMEKCLAGLSQRQETLVFYCPPHRVGRILEAARRLLGDRKAALCRELTKIHEEFLRGKLSELEDKIARKQAGVRGEMVLVVEGRPADSDIPAENLASMVENFLETVEDPGRLGARKLTSLAAERLGLPRNKVYPLVCAFLNRQT